MNEQHITVSLAEIKEALDTILEHATREETRWAKLEITVNGDPSTGIVGLNVRVDRLESIEQKRMSRGQRIWAAVLAVFSALITFAIVEWHKLIGFFRGH